MNTKLLLPAGLVFLALVMALVIFWAIDTGGEVAPLAVPADSPTESLAAYADLSPAGVSTVPSAPAVSQPATLKSMTTVQQAILADTSINEAARESVLDAIDEATVTYLPCGISARRLLRGNW